jgi:hypothetical protein
MEIIVRPVSIRFSLGTSNALALSACLTLLAEGGGSPAAVTSAPKAVKGSTHGFDELRQLEPIRFVLDYVLRSG